MKLSLKISWQLGENVFKKIYYYYSANYFIVLFEYYATYMQQRKI